jgi:hypothetical protein
MAVTHQEMCSSIFVYNCQMAVTICGPGFFFFFPLSKGSYFSQLPNGSFQLTTSSQLGIEMEMGKFQFPFSTSIHVANVCSLFFFFLFLTIKWQLINCTPIDYCNCCQLEMKMDTFQSPFLSSIYT